VPPDEDAQPEQPPQGDAAASSEEGVDAAEAQRAPEEAAEQSADAAEAPSGGAAVEEGDAAAAEEGAAEATGEAPATEAERLAQEALLAAQQAVADLAGGDGGAASDAGGEAGEGAAAQPLALDALDAEAPQGAPPPEGIDLLSDVNLDVRIELGRTTMFVEDVLKLSEGAVVELDKLAGDPVDIYVNDRHVARGEVLILNDNFCVRVSEIIAASEAEED